MNQNTQAKFLTPAETILKLTNDIVAGKKTYTALGNTHYFNNLSYKKSRELLRLALAGQLGKTTKEEATRISEAIEKLDELYKSNRRLPRRPPALETPKLNF